MKKASEWMREWDERLDAAKEKGDADYDKIGIKLLEEVQVDAALSALDVGKSAVKAALPHLARMGLGILNAAAAHGQAPAEAKNYEKENL